jgi:hypothetical protein
MSGMLGVWTVVRRHIGSGSDDAEEDDAASIPWYHQDPI